MLLYNINKVAAANSRIAAKYSNLLRTVKGFNPSPSPNSAATLTNRLVRLNRYQRQGTGPLASSRCLYFQGIQGQLRAIEISETLLSNFSNI